MHVMSCCPSWIEWIFDAVDMFGRDLHLIREDPWLVFRGRQHGKYDRSEHARLVSTSAQRQVTKWTSKLLAARYVRG